MDSISSRVQVEPEALRAKPVRPPIAVCRAIERVEAHSALSQHRCAPPPEAERLSLTSERIGSASAVLTRKSTNLYFNRLIALGQASPATEAQLDTFLELARGHRVKAVAVPVGEAARPPELTRWLKRRGFERGHPSAKLWRGGDPLQRTAGTSEVRVRRARPADASLWVDVVSQVWRSFGYRRPWYEARVATPGWYHYLAWVGQEPVAAAALYVGDVGSTRVGHLVDGVTLGPWRRRGAQRALIRKRIAEGRRLGCELFTSETAPPLPRMPLVSFRNLRRQGFEMAYLRDVWKLKLD
jgi:GNAT superfamily N-acetyltransferase